MTDENIILSDNKVNPEAGQVGGVVSIDPMDAAIGAVGRQPWVPNTTNRTTKTPVEIPSTTTEQKPQITPKTTPPWSPINKTTPTHLPKWEEVPETSD